MGKLVGDAVGCEFGMAVGVGVGTGPVGAVPVVGVAVGVAVGAAVGTEFGIDVGPVEQYQMCPYPETALRALPSADIAIPAHRWVTLGLNVFSAHTVLPCGVSSKRQMFPW